MKRILRSFVAAGFIAAAAAAASGCADNNSTLFIAAVMYAKAPQCLVQPDITAEQLGQGTLDTAFRTSYTAFLLVGNQFSPRGSKQTLRTETTRVTLKGAEILLTDSQGKAVQGTDGKDIGKFSVYGSGYAPPNTSDDPGYGLFQADLIPDKIGQGLRDGPNGLQAYYAKNHQSELKQYVANVQVFGTTTGGTDVESGSLSFPISVCYGCLIRYSFNDIQARGTRSDGTQGEICAPTAGTTTDAAPGCNVGQDDPIPCSFCSTTLAICKDVPAAN